MLPTTAEEEVVRASLAPAEPKTDREGHDEVGGEDREIEPT